MLGAHRAITWSASSARNSYPHLMPHRKKIRSQPPEQLPKLPVDFCFSSAQPHEISPLGLTSCWAASLIIGLDCSTRPGEIVKQRRSSLWELPSFFFLVLAGFKRQQEQTQWAMKALASSGCYTFPPVWD